MHKMLSSSTFAMIKPEAVAVPHIVKVILDEIIANNLEIVGAKRMQLSDSLARQLYSVHAGQFFYERLIRHVISGPVIVMHLRCTSGSAIERWRQMMGSSKMLKNFEILDEIDRRQSLRARYALSDTRNLVHGADSPESANFELQLFQPYPKLSFSTLISRLD